MTLLEVFKTDYKTVPKTIVYKIKNNLATLSDQEEALTNPYYAYVFARSVPGADIKKCEEIACKDPERAYLFARDIHGADIKKCQEAACKGHHWAYLFARFVPGADIGKCEEARGQFYAKYLKKAQQ